LFNAEFTFVANYNADYTYNADYGADSNSILGAGCGCGA
jgi:hypothetical protein